MADPRIRPVIVGLLTVAAVAAQEAPRRLVVDDAAVRAWVAELVPLVERDAGERFREPPEVLLSDPGEVADALAADLSVQARSLSGDGDGSTAEALARRQAGAIAAGLLGKYGFESRVLYLLPEQLDALLDLHGIDRALGEDLFRLVIAHELVHALQDQVLDLRGRLRALTDHDRSRGLSCLIEGHAVFCTERVGRGLGLDAAVGELRRMMTVDPRGARPQAAQALATRSERLSPRTLYDVSTRFVEHHHASGGASRLWEILAAPPPPTAVIFVPERLDAARPPPRDLGYALRGVPELLGAGNWLVTRGTTGEMRLRSENAGAAPGYIERVLEPLVGGAFVELQSVSVVLRKSLVALEFSDEAAATAFTDLAIAAAHVDRLAIEEDVLLSRGAEVVIGPFTALGGCWGTRYRQRPTRVSGVCRGEVVWLRRGPFVVQVTFVGLRGSDREIAEVAGDVLRRLEAR